MVASGAIADTFEPERRRCTTEDLDQSFEDALRLTLPNQVKHGQRSDLVGLKRERRVDPEIPAACATTGPKQLVVAAYRANRAVRGDDFGCDELIARKPVRAHIEADAAAEHEPGNADGRTASVGDREITIAKRRVEVCVSSAAADRGNAAALVERHAIHAP